MMITQLHLNSTYPHLLPDFSVPLGGTEEVVMVFQPIAASDLKATAEDTAMVAVVAAPIVDALFCGKICNLFIINHGSTMNTGNNENCIQIHRPLVTTISTEARRRRTAVIIPPSPEPGKTCCSRQSGSRRARSHRTSAPK
jgi:hypothetical protein